MFKSRIVSSSNLNLRKFHVIDKIHLQGLALDCSSLDWEQLDEMPEIAMSAGETIPIWLALDEVTDPVRHSSFSHLQQVLTGSHMEFSTHVHVLCLDVLNWEWKSLCSCKMTSSSAPQHLKIMPHRHASRHVLQDLQGTLPSPCAQAEMTPPAVHWTS